MSLIWIETALNAGGTLSTIKRSPHTRLRHYRARMEWPGEKPVSAHGMSIEYALAELDRKLMLNAAKEMQRSGKV